MHFNLVDRVLERSGDTIITVKTCTSAEEYLRDHFPDFPILPGVMMLEAMVQAGRAWVGGLSGDEGFGAATVQPMVIAETRQVVYSAMVRPGDTLRCTVTCRGRGDDGVYAFQGAGTVWSPGDDSPRDAVKGRFKLRPIQRAAVRRSSAGHPPATPPASPATPA